MKAKIHYPFLILLLTGCFPSHLVYEPIPCEKFLDCKETIKKVYMLQRPKEAPVSIEVTDEGIFWTKDIAVYHNITGATSVHDQQFSVYFKDIESLRLIDDNSPGRYEIRFINSATRNTYIIALYSKDYAIQGISAIQCMINKAKKDTKGLY